MGVYEWVMLGVMFVVVIVVFFPVLGVERNKNKKLCEQITNEILRVKKRKWIRIVGLTLGALVLFGGTFTTVYCSIMIETPPKDIYAVLMALMAFTILLCLTLELLVQSHYIVATEEGVWVCRFLIKPKFIHYEEIVSIAEIPYGGGYARKTFIVFKESRKKAFTFSATIDKGAYEMIDLLKERAPRLKRWGD